MTAQQTIIVSKGIASSRKEAKKIAARYAEKAIYTSRETSTSYRFRMNPPIKFVLGSFKTINMKKGVSIVVGTLKEK